jgi:hypothetical protein
MKRLITLLLCSALGACASPKSEESAPPPEPATASAEMAAPEAEAMLQASLPEIRYYVISET